MVVVELGEMLDVSAVSALHASFLEAFAEGDSVSINAATLQRVDGPGLQLLAAVCKHAAQHKQTIQWQGVPDSLKQAASVFGISNLLHLEAAAA